jgi:hypothetical protein
MGVPASEVGYTSAGTAGRGDHEVLMRHVVALERGGGIAIFTPYKNKHLCDMLIKERLGIPEV